MKQYDLNKIQKALEEFGYTLNVRAEQLSVEVFVKIAKSLADK